MAANGIALCEGGIFGNIPLRLSTIAELCFTDEI